MSQDLVLMLIFPYFTHTCHNCQVSSSRVFSPVRASSSATFNQMREDFSPSPVPVRHTAVRNLLSENSDDHVVKKPQIRLRKMVMSKALVNMRSQYDESSPDDPRDSGSFLPTPARLKPQTKSSASSEESEVEAAAPGTDSQDDDDDDDDEALDTVPDMPAPKTKKTGGGGKLRQGHPPSDLVDDLGFKVPQKPPSETSEITFKMPQVPQKPAAAKKKPDVSVSGKRKDLPVSSDVFEEESRYLHSWIPRLKNNKLYVEGDLLDFDVSGDASGDMFKRYMTSRIVHWLGPNKIASKKRIYVLEGPLAIKDPNEELAHPTPSFILDKFRDGFPENWEKLTKHWSRMEEQNKKNFKNMSLISSTMLSNLTSVGNSSSFSNVSGINASGWIKMKPSNLSMSRQTNSSIPNVASRSRLQTVSEEVNDEAAVENVENTLASIVPEIVEDHHEDEASSVKEKIKKSKVKNQATSKDEILEASEIKATNVKKSARLPVQTLDDS